MKFLKYLFIFCCFKLVLSGGQDECGSPYLELIGLFDNYKEIVAKFVDVAIFFVNYVSETADSAEEILATDDIKTQEVQDFINNIDLNGFASYEIINYIGMLPSEEQSSGNVFRIALLGILAANAEDNFQNILNTVISEMIRVLSPEEVEVILASIGNQAPVEFPLSCIQIPLINLAQVSTERDVEYTTVFNERLDSLKSEP
ncbi:CLUMA_CG001633, isoform A [Clunio marinus]|uniref:CLUMA_CG001633, isoform A n=1 Tax=Clunio marinus TaxID=568069 RepID=A0A1J1HN00_9DIPT|nr:CLUMA_CG001633, isoform A [Clunio marinus]